MLTCPAALGSRVQMLEDATEHVPEVLQRVKPEYLKRAYKLQAWDGTEDFLAQVCCCHSVVCVLEPV